MAAALLVAVLLHALLRAGLDLNDLPGPGGVLLVRDLLLGEHSQGPASWFAVPLLWLGFEADTALWLSMSLSLVAALLGAGLAAWALGGPRAAPWGTLLGGCWALSAHQSWLLDAGGPAWGLSWLGLGLCWWACARGRAVPLAVGALSLALGVATKASALPVLALLVAVPWLRSLEGEPPTRRIQLQRIVVLLPGLLAGAALGWLLQSPELPWLGTQAATGGQGASWLAAVLALPSRGLAHGSIPLLCGLGMLGGGLVLRRQPAAALVLASTLLALALVGEARAERLQPRHLLPASIGLVALSACIASWRRPGWLAPVALALLCALGALDSLAFAAAFAEQRARYAGTEPAALARAPGPFVARYPELPWGMFHESSIAGAVELMASPGGGESALAGVAFQERRDIHLEVAALRAGVPYLRLDPQRCCRRDEALEGCAVAVVEGLDAAGAVLVLPGKVEVAEPSARPFTQALMDSVERPARPSRWWRVEGRGEGGELPCR
jgi:hypothetical protein